MVKIKEKMMCEENTTLMSSQNNSNLMNGENMAKYKLTGTSLKNKETIYSNGLSKNKIKEVSDCSTSNGNTLVSNNRSIRNNGTHIPSSSIKLDNKSSLCTSQKENNGQIESHKSTSVNYVNNFSYLNTLPNDGSFPHRTQPIGSTNSSRKSSVDSGEYGLGFNDKTSNGQYFQEYINLAHKPTYRSNTIGYAVPSFNKNEHTSKKSLLYDIESNSWKHRQRCSSETPEANLKHAEVKIGVRSLTPSPYIKGIRSGGGLIETGKPISMQFIPFSNTKNALMKVPLWKQQLRAKRVNGLTKNIQNSFKNSQDDLPIVPIKQNIQSDKKDINGSNIIKQGIHDMEKLTNAVNTEVYQKSDKNVVSKENGIIINGEYSTSAQSKTADNKKISNNNTENMIMIDKVTIKKRPSIQRQISVTLPDQTITISMPSSRRSSRLSSVDRDAYTNAPMRRKSSVETFSGDYYVNLGHNESDGPNVHMHENNQSVDDQGLPINNYIKTPIDTKMWTTLKKKLECVEAVHCKEDETANFVQNDQDDSSKNASPNVVKSEHIRQKEESEEQKNILALHKLQEIQKNCNAKSEELNDSSSVPLLLSDNQERLNCPRCLSSKHWENSCQWTYDTEQKCNVCSEIGHCNLVHDVKKFNFRRVIIDSLGWEPFQEWFYEEKFRSWWQLNSLCGVPLYKIYKRITKWKSISSISNDEEDEELQFHQLRRQQRRYSLSKDDSIDDLIRKYAPSPRRIYSPLLNDHKVNDDYDDDEAAYSTSPSQYLKNEAAYPPENETIRAKRKLRTYSQTLKLLDNDIIAELNI